MDDEEVQRRPVVRVTDGGSRRPGSGLLAVVPRIQHAKHSGDRLLGGYRLRLSQGYRRRHARQQFRQELGATNGVDTASVAVVVVVGVVKKEGAPACGYLHFCFTTPGTYSEELHFFSPSFGWQKTVRPVPAQNIINARTQPSITHHRRLPRTLTPNAAPVIRNAAPRKARTTHHQGPVT